MDEEKEQDDDNNDFHEASILSSAERKGQGVCRQYNKPRAEWERKLTGDKRKDRTGNSEDLGMAFFP